MRDGRVHLSNPCPLCGRRQGCSPWLWRHGRPCHLSGSPPPQKTTRPASGLAWSRAGRAQQPAATSRISLSVAPPSHHQPSRKRGHLRAIAQELAARDTKAVSRNGLRIDTDVLREAARLLPDLSSSPVKTGPPGLPKKTPNQNDPPKQATKARWHPHTQPPPPPASGLAGALIGALASSRRPPRISPRLFKLLPPFGQARPATEGGSVPVHRRCPKQNSPMAPASAAWRSPTPPRPRPQPGHATIAIHEAKDGQNQTAHSRRRSTPGSIRTQQRTRMVTPTIPPPISTKSETCFDSIALRFLTF